jgi:hypothetical protein
MINEKETKEEMDFFLLKAIRTSRQQVGVRVGWWWTRPVKELRWVCSREKGGGTKWNQ